MKKQQFYARLQNEISKNSDPQLRNFKIDLEKGGLYVGNWLLVTCNRGTVAVNNVWLDFEVDKFYFDGVNGTIDDAINWTMDVILYGIQNAPK